MNNLFDLSKKKIFITGAYGYLGSHISKVLGKNGAEIYLNGRSKAKILKLKNNLKKDKIKCFDAVFDITKTESVKSFFKKNRSIDIVINNAAITVNNKNYLDIKTSDYQKIFNTNLFACIQITNFFIKNNKKIKKIINISSIYGLKSPIYSLYKNNPAPFDAYCCSKASLTHFTKISARKFANNNAQINSITVGAFPNKKYQKKFRNFTRKLSKHIPLKRVGQLNDLDTTILYLCSPHTNYLTGSNINLDGGFLA